MPPRARRSSSPTPRQRSPSTSGRSTCSRFGPCTRHRRRSTRTRNVVVFSDPTTRTFYIFTTKDNPAHPAWITRQIVEEGGKVNVRQIGYFAGAQEPFDRMFSAYLQLNEQLKHEVEQRNQ
jgi:hypothetical protein